MKVPFYERLILGLTIATLVVFLVAVGVGLASRGIDVPGTTGRVDPAALSRTPPFDQPGVEKVGEKDYRVTMIAQTWAFIPPVVRVPEGSTVTFTATSRDVLHGMKILDTNVNVMLVPGQISTVRHTFEEPGEYLYVCHEYCGAGHQTMFGRVVVEPAGAAEASGSGTARAGAAGAEGGA